MGYVVRMPLAALAAAIVLVGAGCSGQEGYGVAADPTFAEGSTMARLHTAGSVTVGVPYDLPGLGTAAPNEPPEGFTVEIGKIVAGALGLPPESITWRPVEPSTVKDQLAQGAIDLAITAYGPRQAEADGVRAAGSYYLAGQDVLVREETPTKTPDELAGQRVCATSGSVALERLARSFPMVAPVAEPTWDHCVARLLSGSAEAVSGDAPVLLHYVAERASQVRLLQRPFTREDYVIAIRPEDEAFGTFIGGVLDTARADGAWQEAYDRTLGESGLEPMTAESWPAPIPALKQRAIGRPR